MTRDLPFNPDHFRSILCLNGDLPEQAFFNLNLPVIAADGAANTLIARGITPECVIGDLDSITKENLAIVKSHYHYDQNYCDYEKSLSYLEENNLLPAIIVGINGGYLDHILNNINIFSTGNNILYAPPLYGFMLKDKEQKTLPLPLETKLSLFGIPTARVSTTGLEWNLNQSALSFPGPNSCFNRVKEETINITVHNGHVLVLVYTHDPRHVIFSNLFCPAYAFD